MRCGSTPRWWVTTASPPRGEEHAELNSFSKFECDTLLVETWAGPIDAKLKCYLNLHCQGHLRRPRPGDPPPVEATGGDELSVAGGLAAAGISFASVGASLRDPPGLSVSTRIAPSDEARLPLSSYGTVRVS